MNDFDPSILRISARIGQPATAQDAEQAPQVVVVPPDGAVSYNMPFEPAELREGTNI